MMDLIGSVFIIAGFIILGKRACMIKRYRLDFLEKMLYSLGRFEAELGLYQSPIEEALKNSGINEVRSKLQSGFYKEMESDKKDFEGFLKGLSAESLEGQKTNILFYKNKLSEEEKKERVLYKNTSKLLSGASVLLGFLFVFLLI